MTEDVTRSLLRKLVASTWVAEDEAVVMDSDGMTVAMLEPAELELYRQMEALEREAHEQLDIVTTMEAWDRSRQCTCVVPEAGAARWSEAVRSFTPCPIHQSPGGHL